jgi:hypothetical protein
MVASAGLCFVIVLAILYVVPFLVYGVFAALKLVKEPEPGTVRAFLLSVLVQKVGHAVAFVGIFYAARESLSGQWLLYAFLWWLLFVIGEIGFAIGPKYTRAEAAAGIIAETIYLPLAAFLTDLLLGTA